MVAEVDPVLRNELNMVLMVVAPPALSPDVEEANKVDRVFKLLSSAVGAGDGLCGYFHKFPVMLEKIRERHHAHIAVKHEQWAAVAF